MLHLYRNKIEIDKDNLPKSPAIRKIVADLKKEDATNILTFIYLVYDRDDGNPLREFREADRVIKAKKVVFGDSTVELSEKFSDNSALIAKAIREYKNEKIDKIQKDIDLYDKKMYQFLDLLKKTTPNIVKNTHEITGKVSYSTNIDIITKVLDNSIKIILDKSALANMKKTGKYSNELRGGLSPHIQGKTKTTNKK